MYIQAINVNSTQYMLNKLLVSKVVGGDYYNRVQYSKFYVSLEYLLEFLLHIIHFNVSTNKSSS